MPGTVGLADVYGLPSGLATAYSPVSVVNPNGDSVSPPSTQAASGGADASAGTSAASGALGILAALVLLRVLIHVFGEDE